MRRTHKVISDTQQSNLPADTASRQPKTFCSPHHAEQAFALLEGRWKLAILYHLFGHDPLRFSDLERLIPAISQRMLSQQLRALERDAIVRRRIFPEVPPRVEYSLTPFGHALRPVLHNLLDWADQRPSSVETAPRATRA